MKNITLLTLSSVFVLGLLVPSGVQAFTIQRDSDSSATLRIVSLSGGTESKRSKANHLEQSENRMACVSSISPDQLKKTIKIVLRENPEMLMEALEHQSIELAELVDRGSMLKVVKRRRRTSNGRTGSSQSCRY